MISFFVPGKPIPQGSAKAFNIGGVARVVTGARSEATPLGGWRARIAHCARFEMERAGLDLVAGPVRLSLCFIVERPKSLLKKPAAPAISRRCGDIDKLERSILDGLTGICFVDDSQVVAVEKWKVYQGHPDFPDYKDPGVGITVLFEGDPE